MKTAKLVALLFAVAVMVTAQSQPSISVRELTPEAIPSGNCTESLSGYLGINQGKKVKETSFTDQEIGDYVNKRLSQGYFVSIYPQLSGKVYVIATCQNNKKTIAQSQ